MLIHCKISAERIRSILEEAESASLLAMVEADGPISILLDEGGRRVRRIVSREAFVSFKFWTTIEEVEA